MPLRSHNHFIFISSKSCGWIGDALVGFLLFEPGT
jgi:hypothetical protein